MAHWLEPRSLSHAPVCWTWPQRRRCSWAAAVQCVCTKKLVRKNGGVALSNQEAAILPPRCATRRVKGRAASKMPKHRRPSTLWAPCARNWTSADTINTQGARDCPTPLWRKSCAQLQHTEPLITPEHKAPTRPSARRAINTRANAEPRKLITTHSRLPKRLRKSGACTPAWTIQATLRMRTARISRLQQ